MTHDSGDNERGTAQSTTGDAAPEIGADADARPTSATLLGGTRRRFMKTAAAGTLVTAVGASAMTGQTAAVTTSTITPSDGFADVAPWLETENPDVYRITEATRSAVEEAFHASGPRLVVFETSGTIDLGGSTLQITNDKCWVAGQTAPSPGVTFVNGMVQVDANDCVVQHVRSRIGPGSDGEIQGNDSLNTQDETSNNVIDHVTASWGTDECLSVGYDTDRTTVSNCLIYEGLYDPYGDGSDHNYGSLIGDNATDVALLGNVWAKARSRLPRLKGGTRSVVVNNLTYFFDEASNADGSTVTSFVGNVYLGATDNQDPILEGGEAFFQDNDVYDPALDAGQAMTSATRLGSRPLWPSGLSAMGSGQVESHNLSNAGARPADRTANDERIIQEIRDRTGNDRLDSPYDYWIPNPDAVGGYPYLAENYRALDVPGSGLRDWLAEWSAVVETGDGDPGGTGGTSGSGGSTGGTSGSGGSGGTTTGGSGSSGGTTGGWWGGSGSDGGSGGWFGSGGSGGGSDDGGSGWW